MDTQTHHLGFSLGKDESSTKEEKEVDDVEKTLYDSDGLIYGPWHFDCEHFFDNEKGIYCIYNPHTQVLYEMHET